MQCVAIVLGAIIAVMMLGKALIEFPETTLSEAVSYFTTPANVVCPYHPQILYNNMIRLQQLVVYRHHS